MFSAASVFAQTPKSHWAKYDSGKVHYYDVGKSNKKALILIHGWTCNADFWKDSYRAFPEYRVIAIDLPGHGKSDKAKTNYSMEYFARSIDAVMKAAKIKQAVLVGHSMGTPVIRQVNRLYPQETLGLVVVDGPLQPFGSKAQMDKFFEPLFANFKEQGPKFIDGLIDPVRPDLKPSIRTAMIATPDYVAISAMRGMLDDAIWDNDKIDVPVLAIMAKNPRYPPGIEDGYRSVAPKLEFHIWDGVSHFLMMEKPAEFNQTVRSFVMKNKLL
jgi:pimeloyl-ACP methyl ester carboxylesterase